MMGGVGLGGVALAQSVRQTPPREGWWEGLHCRPGSTRPWDQEGRGLWEGWRLPGAPRGTEAQAPRVPAPDATARLPPGAAPATRLGDGPASSPLVTGQQQEHSFPFGVSSTSGTNHSSYELLAPESTQESPESPFHETKRKHTQSPSVPDLSGKAVSGRACVPLFESRAEIYIYIL